jgi:GR25 family glycosyltransferase involved in LPS biosynthesis
MILQFFVFLFLLLALIMLLRRAFQKCSFEAFGGMTNSIAFVINLDQAKDRYDSFSQQYAASDLAQTVPVVRLSAVEGKTLDVKKYMEKNAFVEYEATKRRGFRQTHREVGGPNAVALALSHALAWKTLLKTKHEYAFIFEDDAAIDPEILKYLAYHSLPKFDILLLGYHTPESYNSKKNIGISKIKRWLGLYGYIISREAAAVLLASPDIWPVRQQLDWALSDLAKEGMINVYALTYTHLVRHPFLFKSSVQTPINMNRK